MSPSPRMLQALNCQWDSTVHAQPPAGSTGISWALMSARLDRPNVGAIVQALTATPSPAPEVADETLWSLLSLASQGDDLAARTALQAMLGALSRLGHRATLRGLEDPHETALEAMWTSIRTYPLNRRQRVAANLAGEALAALPMAEHHIAPLAQPLHEQTPTKKVSAPCTEEAAALLVWAHRHHILTQEELQMLTQVYLHGLPTSVIANCLGVGEAATRKRLSRATHKLAKAVRTKLAHPTAQEVVAEVNYELTRH